MNKNIPNSKCCILIADDDEDDQLMLTSAFKDVGLEQDINVVNDGEELLDYLLKKGKYKGSEDENPIIILLDLNMPKKDGRQVLKEIKQNLKLSKIPVIVFSTSKSVADISYCYELGANSFISKPSSYEELKQITETIKRYWMNTVLIPELSF